MDPYVVIPLVHQCVTGIIYLLLTYSNVNVLQVFHRIELRL